MAKKYVRALIKITSKEKYAQDFRNGKLFMNNLKYFIKCEKEELGDDFETTASVIRFSNSSTDNIINLLFKEETDQYIPAFCMFALTSDKFGFKNYIKLNNEKLNRFGDYAVVVKNVDSFLEKLKAHSLYQASLIKYIDFFNLPSVDRLAIFNPVVKKHKSFAHQSEFRIYSPSIRISMDTDLSHIFKDNYKRENSLCLEIGDLSTITSKIYSTAELLNGVKDLTLEKSSISTETKNLDLTTKKSYNRNVERI